MHMSARRTIPITRGGTQIVHATREPVNETTVALSTNSPGVPPAFNELQRNMECELERRKQDWEKEVEKMSNDFFNLQGTGSTKTSFQAIDDGGDHVTRNVNVQVASPNSKPAVGLVQVNNTKSHYVEKGDGSNVYQLKYDVSMFDPAEVKVRAEGRKLNLTAWQEVDHGNGHKSSKQFNRQVDIPANVDPEKLVATVDPDGFLNIEAPVEEERPLLSSNAIEYQSPSPPQYFSVVKSRSPNSSPIPGVGLGTITSIGGYGANASPFIVNVNDAKKLKMAVDIGNEFDCNDVTVKLIGQKIQVSARHEETIAGRTSRREFSREFDLPERLEEGSLRAVLCGDGRLHIGSSVESNIHHQDAIGSVLRDLPIDGKPVRVIVV